MISSMEFQSMTRRYKYTHLNVGDLIQLGSTKEIGIILKILPVEPYKLVTVDYDMLKMDYSSVEFGGETYWYR